MTLKGKRVLVCGAGGFIGGHMVRNLLSSGVASVRAVDIKPKTEWHEVLAKAENLVLDLSEKRNCLHYNLLAPRGVNRRNSDNTRIQQRHGWSPSISLSDGMARTCHWIEREMNQSIRLPHHAGVLERYATA